MGQIHIVYLSLASNVESPITTVCYHEITLYTKKEVLHNYFTMKKKNKTLLECRVYQIGTFLVALRDRRVT